MKSLWIRVEAHAVDSVKIAQLADRLRVRTTEALGLYVALGGAVAEHTEDGVINDVPDETLERWGRWEGRKGAFATAVREIFQSGQGHYDDWDDAMGQLVQRRAADRKRKRRNDDGDQVPLNLRGNSSENPGNVRGDSAATGRNGTERNEQKNTAAFSRAAHGKDNRYSVSKLEAGELVRRIQSLQQRSVVPGRAPTILMADVEAIGTDVHRAYLAVGGMARFIAVTGDDVAFLINDLQRVLSEVRANLAEAK